MCLGLPGKIVSIDYSNSLLLLAQVDFGGISKQVSLSFTPEAKIGQYVIVHAGFAISMINEQQAQELIDELSI
jgi:hydrogenase expression/formation protein HypC